MKDTIVASFSLIFFFLMFIGLMYFAHMDEIIKPPPGDLGREQVLQNLPDTQDAFENDSTQKEQKTTPFVLLPSRVRCTESVPSYHDSERTAFNVRDEMRNTCIFEDLYVDDAGSFFFLEENAGDLRLPTLSVMGFPDSHSAPTAFPANMLHPVKASHFSNDTFVSFSPILNMVSRTYQTHHGHTLFDGVLSCFFAMHRVNLTTEEIARRDTLFQFYDAKGAVPMDDRFKLLSTLTPLYGTNAMFSELPRLDPTLFNMLHNSSSPTARRFIRVERMVIGLAGFGWASAPQTMEWRGQLLREFRTLAFARMNVSLSQERVGDNVSVLIIDRIPSTNLANGKFVNYFSRWIDDEPRDMARLAADLALYNVPVTHVTFEDTPLSYQMSLLQNFSIIITLEGCAMENAPFMRDHTAMIALQYNRRWEHYYYLSARHFVEYAQFMHVAMVSTRIDDSVIPIQNTGGNHGVHLYYDVMLSAVLDNVAYQRSNSPVCNGIDQCGSLIEYSPSNERITHLSLPIYK